MKKEKKQRDEVLELTDENLLDELTRPMTYWWEDVQREALKRILEKLINIEKDNNRNFRGK